MLSDISEIRLVLSIIVNQKTRTCAGHDSEHFLVLMFYVYTQFRCEDFCCAFWMMGALFNVYAFNSYDISLIIFLLICLREKRFPVWFLTILVIFRHDDVLIVHERACELSLYTI